MRKLSEQEILKALEDEVSISITDLDQEQQWDSLDNVKALYRLEDEVKKVTENPNFKFEGDYERELGTKKTPRQIISFLRQGGFVE